MSKIEAKEIQEGDIVWSKSNVESIVRNITHSKNHVLLVFENGTSEKFRMSDKVELV